MAEELWTKLGLQASIAHAAVAAFDPAQLVDDSVQMPIAIKGKVRSHVIVPNGADAGGARRRSRSPTQGFRELIAGKTVHKVIVVPGRMINIVAD